MRCFLGVWYLQGSTVWCGSGFGRGMNEWLNWLDPFSFSITVSKLSCLLKTALHSIFRLWTTVCELFAWSQMAPGGPRGSRGGDLAAAIQNQTQCFPSLAGQGVPAIITTCAEITHSALVTPWETWKGESSRKTILVSIFPWLSGTVCRMSIFGHAGSFCDPICGLLRSFQNGWLTVALHAGKWLISSHMLTPLSRVLGWIIDRP